MTKKMLFIGSIIFVLILAGVAYASYYFSGRQGEIRPQDAGYYANNQDTQPADSTLPPQDPYQDYTYEDNFDNEQNQDGYNNYGQDNGQSDYGGYIAEAPGYEPIPWYYCDSDTASPWHPIHFRDVRAPRLLGPSTPHGYIAVQHIHHLNDYFYSRFPFSYQEKGAAVWIVEELLAMGHPWHNIHVQEFGIYDVNRTAQDIARWHMFNTVYHNYSYLRDTYHSQNVVLTIPGQSSQTIVVGAHYDTVLYPGASDNASGTALLLESAQRMLDVDNYYTIVYIFFGAEEVGLLGARYYVDNLPQQDLDNIIFMINADVLFEGPYFIFGGGYHNPANPWRQPSQNAISQQWEEIATTMNAQHNLDIRPYHPGIFLSSDQLVFMEAGLTVMMLFGTDFHPNGNMYFRVLHSHRDCFHYITNRWPYKIDDAMRTFSIFLEEVLLARY